MIQNSRFIIALGGESTAPPSGMLNPTYQVSLEVVLSDLF
jgi:hypothetical protein